MSPLQISLLLIGLLLRDVTSVVLTKAQRQEFLDAHNTFRRWTKSATNMRMMRWDCRLEKFAADYLKKCKFDHSPQSDRKKLGWWYAGENLWKASDSREIDLPTNLTKALQSWYDEIRFYDYNSGTCTGVCGHYTQVVWADTYALGCAITRCTEGLQSPMKSQAIVSCVYGPGGNIGDQKPYKTDGKHCSACSKDGGIAWAASCVDGLCNDTPAPPAVPACPDADSAAADSDAADSASDAGKPSLLLIFVLVLVQWLAHL